MITYTVNLSAYASMSIDVEVPDDLDGEEARERAIELAYDNSPGDICAQCSGWRTKWGREIGEWELADEKYGPAVERKA